MIRCPGSSVLRPQTRRRSGPPTHAGPQASLTAQCSHPSSRQTVLLLVVAVELAVDTPVGAQVPAGSRLAVVVPLADSANRQSVRFAAHPYIAAAPISWRRDAQPHRRFHLPPRF